MSDPIQLEIFKHLFAAIAEEMGGVLKRTAFSTNIKERLDYSCALFDSDGKMLAQAAHIPVHLGSTPMSVEAAIEQIEMQPGQHIVLNDPYCGGTHLPDITCVSPVFVGDEPTPQFYAANRAHHADIGGQSLGSMPISTHIDDEGFRFAPTLFDQPFIEQMRRSVHLPDEREGDLRAQVAANHVCAKRLSELADRYGLEELKKQGAALIAYGEKMMRAVIADIPDGRWHYCDFLDSDGAGQREIPIEVSLTIAGDRAVLDFAGSADQVRGGINTVLAVTRSAVFYAFRILAPTAMPSNAGYMLPIEIHAPLGSVVNARYPAAVAGGNVETSQRIVDVVLGALSQALPGRIPAASAGTMNNITIGGRKQGQASYSYYETIGGGSGATASGPGASGVQTHMTNTLNTPIEVLEHRYPFRIESYELIDGSGGAGKHQGGDGIRRSYYFPESAEVTLITERRRRGPYGLAGGQPGRPGRNLLIRDGKTTQLDAKLTLTVQPGDRLIIETPGGGGHGKPEN